jgi:SPP1 family predicted phage head-tail adaptor
MNAGRLDRIISIVKTTSTARSTDGAPIMTMATLASAVWASVYPVTGRETYINNAQFYEADTLFTMRYSTVVTELCQISYNSQYYNINKIINYGERNRELQIIGKAVR